MKINKCSIKDIEVKQFGMVLKKFYKTTDKGEPIKFAMIISFEKFGLFPIPIMQKIGKIFESLKQQSQKQLYGSAIILHPELRHVFNKLLNLFKNDRPVSFVKDIETAKKKVNQYISESTFIAK
jgi:hypothetical protein